MNLLFFDTTGLKIIDEETFHKRIELLAKYKNFNQEIYQKLIDTRGGYALNSNETRSLAGFREEIQKETGRSLKINDIIFDKEKIKNEDEILFDFEYLQKRQMREKIERDFNITLEKFTLEEQFQFLNFLKSKNDNEFKRAERNIKIFGAPMAKTFLSIEQGGKEMGNKILTLGEKLPESSNRILFKTYGDIIDASEEVGEILKNSLKEKATKEMVNKAKESLLLNGKNLLDRYSEKAKTCEGSKCEEIGLELEERLSLAKKSVFAFSAACKVLAENGEFSFEDFEKAKLTYDQSPVSEEMKNKIIKMHHENTKQYPDKLRDEWRGTLKEGLENPDPNQLIVSASYDGEIVSTMRVIKKEDGSWYGASFNVNPTIQGGRIGSELLKEVLKDLAKDKPFVADCYSGNPMLSTYLNKFGFKITNEIENYHDTGELVYEITLLPEEKKDV